MRRPPISAVVITRNEAERLPGCLASLRFADEILVVDSGSTDTTVAVAKGLGARVIHQDWLGYGPQKRYAAEQAAHDWILSLDADERLTPELQASIERALAGGPVPAAYLLARRNRFMGRWLRHGEGYPDWCVRLFDRRRAHWSDDAVHERMVVAGPLARLAGDLRHESEQGLADYLQKQNRYTDIQAARMYAAGKRVGALRLLTSPAARFVKFYFLRLGFLDGVPGFVHIAIGCLTAFLKYAKLFELQRSSSRR
jgi:glycosyltransferase involved in cell wall biosynthesis